MHSYPFVSSVRRSDGCGGVYILTFSRPKHGMHIQHFSCNMRRVLQHLLQNESGTLEWRAACGKVDDARIYADTRHSKGCVPRTPPSRCCADRDDNALFENNIYVVLVLYLCSYRAVVRLSSSPLLTPTNPLRSHILRSQVPYMTRGTRGRDRPPAETTHVTIFSYRLTSDSTYDTSGMAFIHSWRQVKSPSLRYIYIYILYIYAFHTLKPLRYSRAT